MTNLEKAQEYLNTLEADTPVLNKWGRSSQVERPAFHGAGRVC